MSSHLVGRSPEIRLGGLITTVCDPMLFTLIARLGDGVGEEVKVTLSDAVRDIVTLWILLVPKLDVGVVFKLWVKLTDHDEERVVVIRNEKEVAHSE